MAFPIIPKKRSGSAGNPTSLQLGELAVNCATGELFLGGDGGVMLLNPPTSAGTTVTEHTGDGTTVAFTFTGYNGTSDGGYLVSVGGIDQPPSKYSVSSTNGGTITFVDAPVAGELISIRAIVSSGGGGGVAGIQAWSASQSYAVGDVVYHINSFGLFIYRCLTANTNQSPYSNWTNWEPLNASAFFIGKDANGNAAGVDSNLVLQNGTTLVWNSTRGVWDNGAFPLPGDPPSNDGGMSAAGITPVGWLTVSFAASGNYKIPYFQ